MTLTIDLSQMPPPDIIDELSFEQLLDERKAELIARYPDDEDLPATLERLSEPVTMLLEESTYRELVLRALLNDKTRSMLLAFATGTTLEHLGSLLGVERLVITPADPEADPPTEAIYELDFAYKARIQLAPATFSTAGPEGAYRFHALSAAGQLKDVSFDTPRFTRYVPPPEVASLLPPGALVLQVEDDAGLVDPLPGDVSVAMLSKVDNGSPAPELQDEVIAALSAADVRPMTDRPRAAATEIIEYQVQAMLVMMPGPAPGPVLAAAQAAAAAYTITAHQLGHDVVESALHAALHQPGVQKVSLIGWSDIVCGARQAAYCTGITITPAGHTDV